MQEIQKSHHSGKRKKTLQRKVNTLGIYFWLIFWVELTPAVNLPQLSRGQANVGPIQKKDIQEIKNSKKNLLKDYCYVTKMKSMK